MRQSRSGDSGLVVAVVKRSFDAWDPSLRTVVIMNAGAELKIVQIVFDRRLDREHLAVKRVVEFECQGTLYLAPFDRVRENTSLDEPLASSESGD